jgi:hypothetical protein
MQSGDLPPDCLHLFHSYFVLIKRLQASLVPTHFQLLLSLLEGIRAVAVQNIPRAQALFKDADTFHHIALLLTAEQRSPRYHPLFPLLLRSRSLSSTSR